MRRCSIVDAACSIEVFVVGLLLGSDHDIGLVLFGELILDWFGLAGFLWDSSSNRLCIALLAIDFLGDRRFGASVFGAALGIAALGPAEVSVHNRIESLMNRVVTQWSL